MTKVFTVVATIILLFGCLQAKTSEIHFLIKKGGQGQVEYRVFDITSDEGGEKQRLEIQNLFKDVENNAFLGNKDGLFTHYHEALAYDQQGKLNGRIYGEFAEIFTVLRLIDDNRYFELNSGKNVSLIWHQGVLTLSMAYPGKVHKSSEISRMVFRTDGIFDQGTSGEITKDRRQTIIDGANHQNFKLVIKELADDKQR